MQVAQAIRKQRQQAEPGLFLPKNRASPQGPYEIVDVDAFEWLALANPNIHAVVTDPPYGLIGYTPEQLDKKRRRKGGVWRIPPSFDGCERSPLPRFSVLKDADRAKP